LRHRLQDEAGVARVAHSEARVCHMARKIEIFKHLRNEKK
jgi:hypothetical protein